MANAFYCENEQVVGCDVDDTLVLWRKPQDGEETIDITDPYDGQTKTLVIHKPHIKLLRDRKARGCAIIVWSQSGPQWARAVVNALGLDEVKPFIFAKPFMIIDDLPAEAWLSNRVYLKPTIGYGNL